MTTLIINIKLLVNTRETNQLLKGKMLADLPCIENAFLLVEDSIISVYGHMHDLELIVPHLPSDIIDAFGCLVMPCWCDSHTHIIFAGSRENEFIDKIKGLSYAEIAARGGGILNSAKKLNDTSEDELFNLAWERLKEVSKSGTGAIEIKSGYGLTVEGELKMLRVIRRLKETSPLTIKATFLGAHTYPADYKENHQGYLDILTKELIPLIAAEKLADYIDVFCETGFFSAVETEYICRAAAAYGLKPKLHVNQLSSIGGIESGIRLKALSLDHLETLSEKEIVMLSGKPEVESGYPLPVCTLLPGAAFFLRMPFQPARQLIDQGAAVALASDYNPGSSPSGNMNFIVSLGCIQMKMLPEEAINAATLNGAYAMEVETVAGSISPGKLANLIFTKPVPSLAYLPYAFGNNLIDKVMIKGEFV